ncbi:MAG TPA: PLP-dependent aminotransferase family protein, partial [Actinomycetota bacterium]|nr:PLP-dependent aminotransferase family protein [Actinomycetota bacterium]
DPSGALGYGAAGGHNVLREQLVELMATQHIEAEPHQLVITNGAQQALEFMAKVFCEPGDLILTEAPTYVGAIGAFSSFQAELQSVATDEDGIIPESLDETLASVAAQGRRAKFLYLVPTFQNPSGYTLSAQRRPQIIEICHRHDVLIVEDDPYAQIRFEGDPVPPLRALTDTGIIYLGTLSKVFSPGIRTGWVLAPEPVRDRLVLAKEAADLCSSPFTQLVAAEYLSSPYVAEDLELIRKVYKERRDTMLDAIEHHFPKEIRVSVPQGGLFLWVTLPSTMDTKSMLARALESGVAYVPGTGFYPRKSDGLNSMRLNFSYPSVAEIEEGIRRLGRVVTEELSFGLGGMLGD